MYGYFEFSTECGIYCIVRRQHTYIRYVCVCVCVCVCHFVLKFSIRYCRYNRCPVMSCCGQPSCNVPCVLLCCCLPTSKYISTKPQYINVYISWQAATPQYTRYVARWLNTATDNWTAFVSAVLN